MLSRRQVARFEANRADELMNFPRADLVKRLVDVTCQHKHVFIVYIAVSAHQHVIAAVQHGIRRVVSINDLDHSCNNSTPNTSTYACIS